MSGITLNEPSSLSSCTATNWGWKGGEAPYALEIQTVIDSIHVLLRFSNILDVKLTSTLNFPAGAILSSIVSDSNGNQPSSTKSFTIEDSGDHGCYALPSSSITPITQKGYGDLVDGEIPSCQPVSILSQGTGPYSISLQSLGTDVATYLNYSSIPLQYLTISLPFTSGTRYQILFQNSTDPSVIAGPGPLNVSSGGGTECLLSNRPDVSTPPAGNDGGNTRSSHPDVGAIVGGAVGGTAVLLLMIGCVFLFLLRRRRSRKSPISDSETTQLDPFPGALATEPSSSISSPMRPNTATGGNSIDRFRNPFKPPTSSTVATANRAVGSETSASRTHEYSTRSPSDNEPIYHRDAGRVEVPPSYNEAGSDSRGDSIGRV